MDVPSPLTRLIQPVVLREGWARPRILVNIAIVVLVVAVPGMSAIVLKPDNPGEGWLALLLAVALIAWQLRRLARAGVQVGPAGIARLGGELLRWSEVVDVHWHTRIISGRQAERHRLHWLRMTTDAGTVQLTRYPARDGQADALTTRLRELGVDVSTPDWSAVEGHPRH